MRKNISQRYILRL